MEHPNDSVLKFESQLGIHGHAEILDLNWLNFSESNHILHQFERAQILQLRVSDMQHSKINLVPIGL